MNIEFSNIEARVIGCLMEKEITTPDLYPLTLNSLTNACNQKSNRDPVMSLSEAQVLDAVDALIKKRLINDESGLHGRVTKYRHRFCNTEFGNFQFTEQEKGVVCCMLLRGAQTPGELRTRSNRLCQFIDVKEVEAVLDKLAQDSLVVKLPREAGKRESRYMHQFSGQVDLSEVSIPIAPVSEIVPREDRIEQLEKELSALKNEVFELRRLIEQTRTED
ncbi:DUF480 domain-containing protein [Psychromonas sp. MB-3u-54]|uniref:YceH family protein n=1 Tax=Psychromonas sp. MB-3u-54 TaxID=2058319 RepID=UPI000C32405F|nr:DUF480 domain-containing protein [Psychromonas sp. MB-3u-54]PKH02091.1 DUF480 domain-containing protein [Psychromonas sp. MB-3u-54]